MWWPVTHGILQRRAAARRGRRLHAAPLRRTFGCICDCCVCHPRCAFCKLAIIEGKQKGKAFSGVAARADGGHRVHEECVEAFNDLPGYMKEAKGHAQKSNATRAKKKLRRTSMAIVAFNKSKLFSEDDDDGEGPPPRKSTRAAQRRGSDDSTGSEADLAWLAGGGGGGGGSSKGSSRSPTSSSRSPARADPRRPKGPPRGAKARADDGGLDAFGIPRPKGPPPGS